MKRAWPAIRWTLDKLLRLAAAGTALVAIPIALIGGPMIDAPATTLTLIAGLSVTVFGFVLALSLLVASAAFWPNQSKKLKRPALIVLTIIYVSGTCGLSLAGAGLIGISYAKSHGLLVPARRHPSSVGPFGDITPSIARQPSPVIHDRSFVRVDE